jgi:hypothetical protein
MKTVRPPIDDPLSGTDESKISSTAWIRFFQSLINKDVIKTLPVYANNAAAVAGGLSAGDLYRTNGDPDTVCVVH